MASPTPDDPVKNTYMSMYNRPFPHFAPVNKHKEMRSRLGWTVSYKSLYFVHPSLELVPLFTGMWERSMKGAMTLYLLSF